MSESDPKNPSQNPETVPEPPEDIEKEPFENTDIDKPKRFAFGKDKRQQDCDFLLGELAFNGKKCTIDEFSRDNNVKIIGLAEIHQKGTHDKQDVQFKLKFLDEKGYRHDLETDRETAKAWIDKNRPNLKEPFYKGNRKVFYFKKDIFGEIE